MTRDERPRGGDQPRGRELLVARYASLGTSTAQIAAQTGLSTATVSRIRSKHHDWIEHEKSEAAENAAARLVGSVPLAAAKVIELMKCGHPNVELGAARTILEASLKWREQVSLEARLATLEEVAQPQQHPWARWSA